jgi:hypothetical protein
MRWDTRLRGLDNSCLVRNLSVVKPLVRGILICMSWHMHAVEWPFVPLTNPPIPQISASDGSTHPIDAFLLKKLEAEGLTMNPTATPRALVRRACNDLIGLPTSMEMVTKLEMDPSEANWERLIWNLLNRPQYGERWASHWLDIVRFAETNGYERDGPKPEAWRFRDYVIQSLNEDKPYDRFIKEQVAGDLMFPKSLEALVATGFYRLHVYDDEPDDALQADYDTLDDILSTIGAAFMGITVQCARCHDHKFDPMQQTEYYQLLDFIHSIEPYGRPHSGGGSRAYGAITQPLALPGQQEAWRLRQKQRINTLEKQISEASDQEKKALESRLEEARKTHPPFEKALAISDRQDVPRMTTHRLRRGDPQSPGEKVVAGFPAMLDPTRSSVSNSRVALANWLTAKQNPMTARVMVNRLWLHHFGKGIVSTPNDFGASGSGATHPELLDHLAWKFMQGGWRLKGMHHYIMTSRAYRMSSRSDQLKARKKDPSNHLFWRQQIRRMDAEVLRDSMLSFSGDLNLKQHGPSVFPSLPMETHHTQDSANKGWGKSPPEEQNRRSIYVYAKRALPLPMLEAFDASHVSFSLGKRAVTTVAPQALMLLNAPFMQARASGLAQRTRSLENIFHIVWQREATLEETRACRHLLEQQAYRLRATGNRKPEQEAMIHLCLALLNANETVMID